MFQSFKTLNEITRAFARALVLLVLGLGFSIATPADDAAALEQLRLAAQKGDVGAQLELGILYEYGFNHPGHETPALAWYTLAAQQGNAQALKRRDALKTRLSAQQVEAAQKLITQLAAAPAPVE